MTANLRRLQMANVLILSEKMEGSLEILGTESDNLAGWCSDVADKHEGWSAAWKIAGRMTLTLAGGKIVIRLDKFGGFLISICADRCMTPKEWQELSQVCLTISEFETRREENSK